MEFVNCRILDVQPKPKDVIQNSCVTADYANIVAEYGGNQSFIQLRGDVAKRFLIDCKKSRHYNFTGRWVCKPKTRPGGRTYYENRFYVENFQRTND